MDNGKHEVDELSVEDQISYYKGKLKELRGKRACSYCGAVGVYAKGLCVNCYHRFLRNGSADFKCRGAMPKEKEPKPKIPWREKLGIDVVGSIFALPNDYDESVDFVLKNTLSERCCDFVLKRYADGLTLRKVGEEFGVTHERARQILSSSITLLRHPRRVKYFTVGKDEITESERREEEAKMLEFLASAKKVEEEKQKALSEKEFRKSVGSAIPIEQLELTVRAFNVLVRGGIKTMADIDEAYGDDGNGILALRNCGQKTLREIGKIVEDFRSRCSVEAF